MLPTNPAPFTGLPAAAGLYPTQSYIKEEDNVNSSYQTLDFDNTNIPGQPPPYPASQYPMGMTSYPPSGNFNDTIRMHQVDSVYGRILFVLSIFSRKSQCFGYIILTQIRLF
ncbi:unnamed protein product [Protopolystoma xenopodis]|uniref:Uncharacterized protein n=1 Tax=Protopolystoma xenopodis TaxID=117903 RepID=A0A448XQ87_9PLAT|nr:unnamed protein product [Protopolystoma xenopodis]